MKIFIIGLLLLLNLITYGQKNGLEYKNNWEYKLSLIKKEVHDLRSIDENFDCKSIQHCLMYFRTKIEEEDKQVLISRMKELAKRLIQNEQLLLLTYGTNGYGGLGFEKLDRKTKKYNYLFVSVNNSCQPGEIDEGINAFNSEVIKHLNQKYDDVWKTSINNYLERKKINKKI